MDAMEIEPILSSPPLPPPPPPPPAGEPAIVDAQPNNPIPSSSPAFRTQTPLIKAAVPHPQLAPVVLPILLPLTSLRPLAFRTFTKKHNLTLTSSALQALATFIGKHCGAGWREEGLAEPVLEEVAKSWKKTGGGVIVDGDGEVLTGILKTIAGGMAGGKLIPTRALSRQTSMVNQTVENGAATHIDVDGRRPSLAREDGQSSLAGSNLALLGITEDDDDEEHSLDPRSWLKVIGAFEQPRIVYNATKRQFESEGIKRSLLPPASHKIQLFHFRYHIVHQRLMRDESFQRPALNQSRVPSLQRSASTVVTLQNTVKITSIANMLGRSGSSFLLLGLLTVTPTGLLAISDLTGSIVLDLRRAKAVPDQGLWFTPGMFILVEGIYEDEGNSAGGVLDDSGGVGGTIGGKFTGRTVRSPPSERRAGDLTMSETNGDERLMFTATAAATAVAGGTGLAWIDRLGVGSERAVGPQMRRIEKRVFAHDLSISGEASNNSDGHNSSGRGRIVFLGEVQLDRARTLEALGRVLSRYEGQLPESPPLAIVITGHFVQNSVMSNQNGDCVDYKESFNALASILSDMPRLLRSTTFIFVPSDYDAWVSAFSAGASTILPRRPVPEMFTSRIKRAFSAVADQTTDVAGINRHREGGRYHHRTQDEDFQGKAIWTTNPSRISLFGPSQEIVLFRDNMIERLRRNAVHFPSVSSDQDMSGSSTREKGGKKTMKKKKGMMTEIGKRPSQRKASSSSMEAMEIDPQTNSKDDDHNEQQKDENDDDDDDDDEEDGPKIGQDPQQENRQISFSLIKTLLDQAYLSPFPLSIRPVLWDHVNSLLLHPLPTLLLLVDPDAPPFALRYQGCLAINPGPLLDVARRGAAADHRRRPDLAAAAVAPSAGSTSVELIRWAEYDARTREGRIAEMSFS